MILEATPLAGLTVVRPERHADDRGYFARTFCSAELASAGFAVSPVQMSTSFSARALTLRGMHWQAPPHAETKLVRVTRGEAFDVAVDLRPGSLTLGRWYGRHLSAVNGEALLIPPGFAHGLLTLVDETEVLYAMDVPFAPDAARGARFDDPAFAISWPATPAVVAAKDLAWPAWTPS